MADKTTAMHKATKLSWKRANALHELADTEKSRPAIARNFLSKNKSYADLFEGKADKRNPKVREALEAYTKFCENPGVIRRPSKGDPNRQVRAGAPKSRVSRKGGKPRTTTNPAQMPAEVLFDLRKIQRKYGISLTDLLYATNTLSELCDDSPIDIDHFFKQIQKK